MKNFFDGLNDDFRKFLIGIKNLIFWLPIIWKDRNWDYYYILKMLKHKLKLMDKEQSCRYTKICQTLIDRIQDDYYYNEMNQYIDRVPKFIKIAGTDRYGIEFIEIRNNLDVYVDIYPKEKKRILAKFPDKKDNLFGLSVLISMERHKKAKSLLFSILNNKIETWWS